MATLPHAAVMGTYVPGDSILHRLDPRTKLIGFGALAWVVFSAIQPAAAAPVCGLVVGIGLLSRVGVRFWLGPVMRFKWMLVAVFVMNVLFSERGITAGESAWRAMLFCLQLFDMILLSVVLGLTTPARELAGGTIWFLSPLRFVKAPVEDWGTALMLALRFIPMLQIELRAVIEARRARPAMMQARGVLQKARNSAATLAPAFHAAMRRSELIAEGLAARGFQPGGDGARSATRGLSRLDYLTMGLIAAAAALIRFMQWRW